MKHTRTRTALTAAVLLLALLLTGCGDDTSADGAAESVGEGTSAQAGEEAPVSSESEGDGPSADLESLGRAVERSMGGVEDYDVDGTALTIRLGDTIQPQEVPSACMMVGSLARSLTLPEGAAVSVSLGGETTDCDI